MGKIITRNGGNRMNKTRLPAGILAALMLLSVLAACGTPVEEPTVTNDVTAGADVTVSFIYYLQL